MALNGDPDEIGQNEIDVAGLQRSLAGAVELCIPKLDKGSYFPGFLEPRRMAKKALTAVI